MAVPWPSRADEIVSLLGLNANDSTAYRDEINAYFGETDAEDHDSSFGSEVCTAEVLSSDTCDPHVTEDDTDSFTLVEDLAERIVPLQRLPPSTLLTDHSASTAPAFGREPCKCGLNNGKPCYTAFERQDLEDCKLQFLSLTREELDIVILSKLQCGIHLDNFTRRPKQSQQTERKASRSDYFHHGKPICRKVFKHLHGISSDKLNALITHYKLCGVEARRHKNSKRAPANALKYDETRMVVDFIINYAEVNAIILPGRTPHNWITDVKLLPTSCTKHSVYNLYKDSAQATNIRVVGERTFRLLWQELLPFIRTSPPASDLCWVCQQGTIQVMRAVNRADEEKSAAIKDLEHHQTIVAKERSYYRSICEEVKRSLPDHLSQLGKHPHQSYHGKVHYSFDFAQQLHFPYNPHQPGPIYFKTPRKCGLFGINCESLSRQVNFLIDEAHSTGKGANTVISLLHYFLDNYSLGEADLHLHADNCVGQNKNSAMINYLQWRCLTGRNRSVQISFMIVGHTKFSPDAGFGLIKRKFKHTKVDCLQDITDVVNASSSMNMAHLVGTEQGPSTVPTYDWTLFFSNVFTKVKNISSFHHFHMSNTESIELQQYADSEKSSQKTLKAKLPLPNALPPTIPSPGLPLARQRYLYKEIRPFVDISKQDIVCPYPGPEEEAVSSSSSEDEALSHSDGGEPVVKRKKATTSRERGRGCGRGRGRGRGRGQNKTI